jgi:cell division transport system ATP-binding protein
MPIETVIHLQDASIFQQSNEVLSNVELSISRGEFVYLVGKTASGKSSLIKTLTGELPLIKGTGRVCGFMLDKLKEKQLPYLRRNTGIVFQDFQLLTDRNVYDNLVFVLKATGWAKKIEINARISEVLGKVGLLGKEKSFPNQLSGGEQQRVVIARALLNNPPVLLADEPTGHLDPSTSIEIASLLHEICKSGKTVLMATHNYVLMRQFPARAVICENGNLTELQADWQEKRIETGTESVAHAAQTENVDGIEPETSSAPIN